jgi:hypothetical protein
LIQLGVFLTPLSVGTHVVTIRGEIGSQALFAAYGFSCLQEDFTYSVTVARRVSITDPTLRPTPAFGPGHEAVCCAGRADAWREVCDNLPEPCACRRRCPRPACAGVPVPLLLPAGLCVSFDAEAMTRNW